MPALCNCSLSHWSTILFCNTNTTHIFIHAYELFIHSSDFPFSPHLRHPLPRSYLRSHHYKNNTIYQSFVSRISVLSIYHVPFFKLNNLKSPFQQFKCGHQYTRFTTFTVHCPLLWPRFLFYPKFPWPAIIITSLHTLSLSIPAPEKKMASHLLSQMLSPFMEHTISHQSATQTKNPGVSLTPCRTHQWVLSLSSGQCWSPPLLLFYLDGPHLS